MQRPGGVEWWRPCHHPAGGSPPAAASIYSSTSCIPIQPVIDLIVTAAAETVCRKVGQSTGSSNPYSSSFISIMHTNLTAASLYHPANIASATPDQHESLLVPLLSEPLLVLSTAKPHQQPITDNTMAAAAKRVVVVGGVAGGASAAARLRRLTENASITIFERHTVSYANCGLPYYVGNVIDVSCEGGACVRTGSRSVGTQLGATSRPPVGDVLARGVLA
jgi:hypothetical protein